MIYSKSSNYKFIFALFAIILYFITLNFGKMQKEFIKLLKSKSNKNTSFAEEIATILDIGYDAAYRRINLKTNLSLEETVLLAKHYKVSLNKLFEVGSNRTILAEISPELHNEANLEEYFIASRNNVYPLTKLKNASIVYSAKDIPLFHTLKDSYLSRYKIYVWLKDVDINFTKDKTSFDDYINRIPQTLLEVAFDLGNIYKNINITEIWNDSTINGTLQQVQYYFESGLLSQDLALKICEDIIDVIKLIEDQAIQQSLSGSENKAIYSLYMNEIHTMSNTIMVKTPNKKVFFTPFTVLSYFKIEHQPTCEIMSEFFEKQMRSSKLLINAGEKDRTLFFNKMHQKINSLKQLIKVNQPYNF
ncbi:MAG: hypothetical protein ACI8WA_001336 [Polaribacter sp.]|jgi:hypothetical protein